MAANATDALMHALDFTEADLAANRRGKLTDHQRKLLRAKRRDALLLPSIVVIALSFAILASFDHWTPAFPLIALVGFATLIAALFFGYRFLLRFWRDLNGKVESVAGRVETHFMYSIRRSADSIYSAQIDGKTFKINTRTFAALSDTQYRAYYTPYTLTILALEPIDTSE